MCFIAFFMQTNWSLESHKDRCCPERSAFFEVSYKHVAQVLMGPIDNNWVPLPVNCRATVKMRQIAHVWTGTKQWKSDEWVLTRSQCSKDWLETVGRFAEDLINRGQVHTWAFMFSCVFVHVLSAFLLPFSCVLINFFYTLKSIEPKILMLHQKKSLFQSRTETSCIGVTEPHRQQWNSSCCKM